MSYFQIDVAGGKTVRLPTAGKYCDRDILVTGKSLNFLAYNKSIDNLVQSVTFPEGYEIYLDLPVIESMSGAFRVTKGLINVKLACNEGQAVKMWNTFSYSSVEVVDFSEFKAKFTDISSSFTASWIVEILGEFDLSLCTNTNMAFAQATELVEVRFKQGTIPISISFAQSQRLSDASIQSIIDGLADLTGKDAQTLSFHNVVGKKLTEAQKASVSAKNWTLAY